MQEVLEQEVCEAEMTILWQQQFKIPEPYRAWCHLCNQGFAGIDEIQKHDRDKKAEHQRGKQ